MVPRSGWWLLDESGRVLKSHRYATRSEDGPDQVIAGIAEQASELRRGAAEHVQALGVGVGSGRTGGEGDRSGLVCPQSGLDECASAGEPGRGTDGPCRRLRTTYGPSRGGSGSTARGVEWTTWFAFSLVPELVEVSSQVDA